MNIEHPLVGKFVATTQDVTFANGSVIKAGAKGRVLRCELNHTLPTSLIINVIGNGERQFFESQLRVLEKRSQS